MFFLRHIAHFLLLTILAASTAAFGYIGYVNKQPIPTQNQPISEITSVQPQSKASPPLVEVNNFVSSTISVTLTVQTESFSIPTKPGGTTYDLMKKAEELDFIEMKTKDYGGDLGHLVEEINSKRSNPQEKKYWIYYINGKKASIGISTYKPQAGDTISWKYEDEAI